MNKAVKHMEKDRIFAQKKEIEPFAFTREVARVFDDMLVRSVPLYREGVLRQARMAEQFFQKKTRIYDLGCSHGNLGILILEQFGERPFTMIGVDNSRPMIEKYRDRLNRLKTSGAAGKIDLVCAGMEEIQIKNASVVIINLTLQFLDLEKRDDLIKKIYQGLVPGGILLLTEKTIGESRAINEIQLDAYRRFKRENGYSDLEISQKRDALEKVLVPESVNTHIQRLARAGFEDIDIWLKWFNFASFIAIK
ncbi:carboxy-S-adenosyl-L-methionine synthase CmoA [Desulfospira joergensenii]|uniref:carboxy-S-adenosyl-L-methionine synthase CmoA n=1 Tax=Desulfospira joergensenii TaxID=53329 RepID=UPI0003B3464D|nr:carboxy-S-adenosyl-L-methionine synthase CmoA [Desulfospira joergensenii]